MALYAAANLDDDAFPEVGQFLLDRDGNRHLAFGDGIHKCQGAAMGRLEMRVVLEEVLDAIPDYALDRNAVTFRATQGVHSVSSLPVTFTPRPADWFAAADV